MTKKKNLDYNKVIEFYNYPSLFKFRNTVTSIKFSDGTCMSYFWKHHKDKIKDLDNEISREIYMQYEEFLKMMRLASEKRYNERLIEFAENKNFGKFFSNNEKFVASDSTLKSFWHTNKNKILSSDDEISQKIVRQYNFALKKQKLMLLKSLKTTSNYEPIDFENFIDRLNDFIDGPKEKYSPSYEITFYDGADMHNWFLRSKERIEKYKPEIYKVLIKEYDEFRELRYQDSLKIIGDKDEKKK